MAVTASPPSSDPGDEDLRAWRCSIFMGDTDCRRPSALTSAPHRDLCRPGQASSQVLSSPTHRTPCSDYSSPRTFPKRAQCRRIPAASAHLGPALCEDLVLTVNQNKSLWRLWAAPPLVWTAEHRAWFSGRVTSCALRAPAVAALGELRLCGEGLQMQEDASGGGGFTAEGS